MRVMTLDTISGLYPQPLSRLNIPDPLSLPPYLLESLHSFDSPFAYLLYSSGFNFSRLIFYVRFRLESVQCLKNVYVISLSDGLTLVDDLICLIQSQVTFSISDLRFIWSDSTSLTSCFM